MSSILNNPIAHYEESQISDVKGRNNIKIYPNSNIFSQEEPKKMNDKEV